MEHIGHIYEIVNSTSGKIYIGQTTKKMYQRLNTHFSKFSRCERLKSAIASYGKENFQIYVIEKVCASSKSELVSLLNVREKFYIEKLNTLHPNGYNLTNGGDHFSKCDESIARSANGHKKPVLCKETGQIWSSVAECAEYFNVKPKQISRVLKGQRKRLKWAYTLSYIPKQS